VNENAIKELATTDKLLLPFKQLDKAKDVAWNVKAINSQMMQGILIGESIPDLAQRLLNVTNMDEASAIRNARTMTTSAENKGRQDSYEKAQSDGVVMVREWIATGDDRTRDWHRDLDGVEVGVDEPWTNTLPDGTEDSLMYPGDPDGDPANIYNCRCAMRVHVKGFDWNKSQEEESEEVEAVEVAEETKDVLHTDNIDSYNELMDTINVNHVSELPVSELSEPLTQEEIIEKLAGGDMTGGSCASLSCAYAANSCGLDVTDFRGGVSREVFSRDRNLTKVFDSANATYTTYNVTKEVSDTAKILKDLPISDKEYILVTGRHASIIRNTAEAGLEYLELQSPTKSGWQPFAQVLSRTYMRGDQSYTTKQVTTISDTLNKRFGCRKAARTIRVDGKNVAWESKVHLVDVASFKPTEEFKDVLGYINTETDAQKKGALGSVK
jgi:hypothetical protein